jgi:CheY-like chemotaxis protein
MDKIQKNILVVDDEPDIREILTAILDRNGYSVLTASNGLEALDILKINNIDLVISDIQMPGGNGIDLLDNIRKIHHETPIVLFITGFADITLEDAYDKGAEAVFAKPFDHKRLLAVIESSLTPKDQKWIRRENRTPADIAVKLIFPNFPEARGEKILNIGRGGIFVSTESNSPHVNDNISFKIEFEDKLTTVIEGTGIVRWVRPNKVGELSKGCGIEFVDLEERARLKIIELINFLKTRQYIPKG